MPEQNGKAKRLRPEPGIGHDKKSAERFLVESLRYYIQAQEEHLDKLLELEEHGPEVITAYANAKDLAYEARLCTKDARGEFVKTLVIDPTDEDLANPGEHPSLRGRALHAIIGYQGAVRLQDALGTEVKHTDTELSIARRTHDTAVAISNLVAGVDPASKASPSRKR